MESKINTSCQNKKLIIEAMKLAEKMLMMSDHGTVTCEDDSCLLIYGVIRDCGYKIRRTIEEEQFSEISASGQLLH